MLLFGELNYESLLYQQELCCLCAKVINILMTPKYIVQNQSA